MKRKETLKDDVYIRKDVEYQKMDEWEKLFYGKLSEYAFLKVQKQLKLFTRYEICVYQRRKLSNYSRK